MILAHFMSKGRTVIARYHTEVIKKKISDKTNKSASAASPENVLLLWHTAPSRIVSPVKLYGNPNKLQHKCFSHFCIFCTR